MEERIRQFLTIVAVLLPAFLTRLKGPHLLVVSLFRPL